MTGREEQDWILMVEVAYRGRTPEEALELFRQEVEAGRMAGVVRAIRDGRPAAVRDAEVVANPRRPSRDALAGTALGGARPEGVD